MGAGLVKCKNDLGQEWEQLSSTRQHMLAYISAMASWIKAYIIRLGPVVAAAAVPAQAGEIAADPSSKENHDLNQMMECLQGLLHGLGPMEVTQSCEKFSVSSPCGVDRLSPQECAEWSHDSNIILLVWIARAVEAVAQQLLGCCGQCRTAADSGKSGNMEKKSTSRRGTSSCAGASNTAGTDKAACAETVLHSGYDMQGTGAAILQTLRVDLYAAHDVVLLLVERIHCGIQQL
jgi:hypothetical protein